MQRFRVIHVTSAHPVNDVRINYKECTTLSEAGFGVTLIGIEAPAVQETPFAVVQLPIPKSRTQRMLWSSLKAYRAAVKADGQVYHIHDPEMLPFTLLLKWRKKKVIFDAHEDLPAQIMSKAWIPGRLRSIISRSAAWAAKISTGFIDGYVAATPFIAERFPKAKTEIVQNYPLSDELFVDDGTPYLERPFEVTYIGGISRIRGINEMVSAMQFVPVHYKARLSLAGKFESETLYNEVILKPGWKSVNYLGLKPRPELKSILGRSRAGLVIFYPEKNHIEAQPNKLFEYMSAGIPVIVSDFPLWRKLIESVGCGILVDPKDPHAISKAITWVFEHPSEAHEMGKRGREAVEKQYNWPAEAGKLLTMYRKVLKIL
ncbi:MAG TPA: group 1 glycosyl transferase [Firmicutes bacterium]|nr:group 1 glycosyl transferase [Bacillota bacterium]